MADEQHAPVTTSDADGRDAEGDHHEPADLLADIDVQADPERAGRFTLDLSPAWNIFYTFGGVTMAAAMRAVERGLGRPDLQPLTAHALFCAPLGPGPIEIDVDVIRDGRTAAQVSVDMRRAGTSGTDFRMLCIYGQQHETPMAFRGVDFPGDVRPPEECPDRPDPGDLSEIQPTFPPVNFHRQTEWRPAMAGFRWDESLRSAEPLEPRFASWFHLKKEPRLPDGTLDPVSYCLPADTVGSAVARGLGPLGLRPFLILSLEINLQFFGRTTSAWTLQNTEAQWAGDGYAFGTTELWDDQRQLIGFATQRARLRPFTLDERLGPDR
jgi:acyl-CoA thioesterase